MLVGFSLGRKKFAVRTLKLALFINGAQISIK